MGFEDNPADDIRVYPCDVCDGDITEHDGVWSCNKCNWTSDDCLDEE